MLFVHGSWFLVFSYDRIICDKIIFFRQNHLQPNNFPERFNILDPLLRVPLRPSRYNPNRDHRSVENFSRLRPDERRGSPLSALRSVVRQPSE